MPAPQAKLGAKWLSPTDIRSTVTRIGSNRTKHSNLLRTLDDKLIRHGEQVSNNLRGLDARDRPSVVTKAVSGMRAELVRESSDQRLAHTPELAAMVEQVKGAASHYRSPIQMLTRETIGSERRSRIMEQIDGSGPVELASLAEYAAATGDKELAAALCSRVADLPRADRPFSAAELADVMFGELHRELSQALVESERRVLEALNEDKAFETGKRDPQRTLQIALLKKREREIGAYVAEGEDIEDEGEEAEEISEAENRIAAGLLARREAPITAEAEV